MARMDQAGRFPSPRRIYPTLLLAAAYLLTGCSLATAEQETGSVEKTMGAESTVSTDTTERPNIILIVTDDLDANSISRMPNLRSLLIDRGTTFENAFVTDALCCPSRASILRGQYPHNHLIEGNEWPQGGARKFHALGRQRSTIATWLRSSGYQTVLIGKYLNDYQGTYVPPGWDNWHAVSGNYESSDLNENGHIVSYDPGRYHLDDVLADKATDFIRDPSGNVPSFLVPDRPFFMWIGTKAPHQPADPAPRDEDAFPNVSMPRPPSFDEEDVSDKPDWISDNPPLGPQQIAYAEDLYRKRLQSMLAVDDAIGKLVNALKETGELDNTYIFFTSDNGFHLGTHRLSVGKWTAYEEDIRIPLIVRGPGVPEGKKLEHLVLNNDFAPTFADLAGVEVPTFVDGRSLVPLLSDDPPPPEDWRQAFLVESIAESAEMPSSVVGNAPLRLLTGDTQPSEDWRRASPLQRSSIKEAGRPAFKAVRTEDHMYAEYETGESELYDLDKDPYELHNEYEDTDLDQLWRFEGWLDTLRDCAGEECRAAEDGYPQG
jgi:N-acetylglucosamine-6-sulfatase